MSEIRSCLLSSGAPTAAEALPAANTPRVVENTVSPDPISSSFHSVEIKEESLAVIIPNIVDEFLAKIKSDDTRLTRKEVENYLKDLKEILIEKMEGDNTGGRGGSSKKILLTVKITLTIIFIIIFALYVNACLYSHDPTKRSSLYAMVVFNWIIMSALWWYKNANSKVRFPAVFSDLISSCFQSEEIIEESAAVFIPKILDDLLAKIESDNTSFTIEELEVTLKKIRDLKEILLEKIEGGNICNTGGREGSFNEIPLTNAIALTAMSFVFACYVSAFLYSRDLAKIWAVHVMTAFNLIFIVTLWLR
ncbi:uncharacterized protein LOC141823750 [Curcuma longa]|uniref:uncharacterized protein LOC141823750 n=1 Tax=Curcuma longa TaxID=136217 RepID=UPI003D9F5F63